MGLIYYSSFVHREFYCMNFFSFHFFDRNTLPIKMKRPSQQYWESIKNPGYQFDPKKKKTQVTNNHPSHLQQDISINPSKKNLTSSLILIPLLAPWIYPLITIYSLKWENSLNNIYVYTYVCIEVCITLSSSYNLPVSQKGKTFQKKQKKWTVCYFELLVFDITGEQSKKWEKWEKSITTFFFSITNNGRKKPKTPCRF